MILLIFGGLAWFLFGKPSLELPDFSRLRNLFKSEKKATPSKGKGRVADSRRGQVIDSYRGVDVFYNGRVGNVSGRNVTRDGYNLGLKYQCVEFAKRFYYEAYGHKMPDSYGHAKDFFDGSLPHGAFNRNRGMAQYRNGGPEKPRKDDLVIIGASADNNFGHLFILTKVTSEAVEFIQQNPGSGNPSRGRYPLKKKDGNYYINADQVAGWLRLG